MTKIPLEPVRHTENLVFISGNGPIDPETGEIVSDDVEEQAIRTLLNIRNILEEEDLSLDDIVKTTAFITDETYYETFNEGYSEVIEEPFPARSCVVTGIVTEGQKVEIEAIAEK